MINAKENTITIQNTHIDYLTFGKGEKTLIIIPGLSFQKVKGNKLMLSFMYRIFAKEYKVFFFDKRNVLPDGFTVKNMADDIKYAMDSLEIKDAYVFGASLGGMIALELAADHPQLIKKLALAVTSSRANESVVKTVNTWISMAEKGYIKGIIMDMLPKMYSEKYIRRYKLFIPLMAKIAQKSDISRFINMAKACLTADIYDRLQNITCPTFVIGGKKDMITSPEGCYEISEKLGCEIYMYEEYGHAAYEEAKDFNKKVYDFLEK